MLSKFKNKLNKQSGFTLLEILLVVGIISILAGIVIVAINPSKQLATVRNIERKSDIKQIDSALTQYYIDNFHYPTDITSSWKEICDTGSAESTTTAQDGTVCTTAGLANLSSLVPTYITAIPKDPSGDAISFLNKITTQAYAATGGNGYKVIKDATSGKLGISATNAELSQVIALGVSTSTGGGEVVSGCVATGGNVVDTTSAPGYKIHKFTSSGTLTVSTGCDVEILVVAGGGGGGGYQSGGGGGAGGLIYDSAFTVTSQAYTVTVGAGGQGGNLSNGTYNGDNGEDSVFSTLTAIGGGYGNRNQDNGPGGTGGSGGGGGGWNGNVYATGGSGTVGQGSAGGAASGSGVPYGGGGGGGAGGVGSDATDNVSGGNGGPGLAYSISGASVYYAGGGGGGSGGGTPGSGGLGGGGDGSSNDINIPVSGTDGTPNTGGGGGGAWDLGYFEANGGNGGSGVVIVRYAI